MTDRFDRISNVLQRVGAEMEASEAHGLLCGMLCKNAEDWQSWVDQIIGSVDPQSILVREARQELVDLYETTIDQLRGEAFELQLLLRNDDDPMDDRLDDLTLWCQGFLTGLASTGLKDMKKLPETVQEVITDFLDISRVGYEPGEDAEENEHAYTEIVEYIRVGVMLVFAELHIGEGEAAPTLH